MTIAIPHKISEIQKNIGNIYIKMNNLISVTIKDGNEFKNVDTLLFEGKNAQRTRGFVKNSELYLELLYELKLRQKELYYLLREAIEELNRVDDIFDFLLEKGGYEGRDKAEKKIIEQEQNIQEETKPKEQPLAQEEDDEEIDAGEDE